MPARTLPTLDAFTAAYVAAALWSSTDQDGEPLDSNYDLGDIAPEALTEMVEDCKDFQDAHLEDIEGDLERAGHDFWLTRNRHGAGFWDGDWGKDVGRRLTAASHPYGGVDLYVGDDGLIYA